MAHSDTRIFSVRASMAVAARIGLLGACVGLLGMLAGCGGGGPRSDNAASAQANAVGGGPNVAGDNAAVTYDPAQAQVTGAPGTPNPQQQRWLAQATAFAQKPEQQRDLQTALRARASTHPAFCPTATFVPKRVDIAFDPQPQFATDGSFTQGTIVYRSTMQGCAMPVLLTVYIDAAPGTPLRFRSALPGTTFADPDLQERAIPQAVAAARPLLPGCARLMPIDTRRIGQSPSATGTLVPWSEYWLVSGCGRMVNVKLDFTPDHASNQMLVRADPSATRMVRTGGGAAASGGAAIGGTGDGYGGVVPSGPGGTVVATATGTSLIPLGGADIPGAKVAGTCLLKLREATPMAPDQVNCPVGLAPRAGATTACSASKGAVQGSMHVAVSGVAGGSVTFQCVVRKP